jgi:hypothetical protein
MVVAEGCWHASRVRYCPFSLVCSPTVAKPLSAFFFKPRGRVADMVVSHLCKLALFCSTVGLMNGSLPPGKVHNTHHVFPNMLVSAYGH